MLNYILPPIIIIVCTALLIMFLFRKVKQLPVSAQEIFSENFPQEPKKRMAAITSAIGQFGLKILEKIMQKLKLMALKFHNVSNDCFHSIREKREHRSRMQQEMIKKNKQQEEKMEKRISEVISRSQKIQPQPEQISQPLEYNIKIDSQQDQQEKIIEKNKLEDVLIRRIAANPKDVEAYERLGDYYLERENLEDSMECFRQVLTLSPINYKARLKMRRIEKIIR